MRTITLPDFLTPQEINRAAQMWKQNKDGYTKRVCERIIKPNIKRINEQLKQENDPMYLAYAVEYVMLNTIKGSK